MKGTCEEKAGLFVFSRQLKRENGVKQNEAGVGVDLCLFSLSSYSSQNDRSPHTLQFQIPLPLAFGLRTHVV